MGRTKRYRSSFPLPRTERSKGLKGNCYKVMCLEEITLAALLEASDETIKRNAISIIKRMKADRERRIADMKETDAQTGDNPNATLAQYREWADEEVLANL